MQRHADPSLDQPGVSGPEANEVALLFEEMRRKKFLVGQAKQRLTYGAVLVVFILSAWQLSRRNKVVSQKPIRAAPSEPPLQPTLASTSAAAKAMDASLVDSISGNALGNGTQAAQLLATMYTKMADDFREQGFDEAALTAMHSWYHGLDNVADTPWPRRYANFSRPLAPMAVRLLVIPISDSAEVAAAGAAITRDVIQLLPTGTKVFANARTAYHCTLFHTSHPNDPRPDPTQPDGGLGPDAAALPPYQRRGPTDAEMANERELMRQLVAESPPPTLQLDRVLLARSGTLLLMWTDGSPEGAPRVEEIRRQCRSTFPGSTTKQANIIHSSLLRVVAPPPEGVPPAVIASIQAKLDEWTAKLKGLTFTPNSLWFVREEEFSTLAGERDILPLAQARRR